MADPLHQAARQGNIEELQRLLEEQGMDPNGYSQSGLSPLHVAATTPNLSVVDLLLEKGAKIDQQAEKGSVYDGYCALHFAAERPSSAPLLSHLLQKGATNLIQDALGRFPLHVACLKGNMAAVEILLSQPDAPLFLNARDVHGRTALMLGCSQGHAGVAERLLKERETEKEGADQDGNTALHHCFQVQSQQLFNYNYPLLDGHYLAAFILVKAGAPLALPNHDGDAPLDVIHESLAQLLEVVSKERDKLEDVESIEELLMLEEEALQQRGMGVEVISKLLNAIGAYSKVMERELALRKARGSCPFVDSSSVPEIRKFSGKGADPSLSPFPRSQFLESSQPGKGVCPMGFVGEMPSDHAALSSLSPQQIQALKALNSPSPSSFPFSRSSLSSFWLPLSVSLVAAGVAFAAQRYLKI